MIERRNHELIMSPKLGIFRQCALSLSHTHTHDNLVYLILKVWWKINMRCSKPFSSYIFKNTTTNLNLDGFSFMRIISISKTKFLDFLFIGAWRALLPMTSSLAARSVFWSVSGKSTNHLKFVVCSLIFGNQFLCVIDLLVKTERSPEENVKSFII